MATAPPMDIVHKATLINRAMTPIYNHVFMALPAQEKDLVWTHCPEKSNCSYGQKLSTQKQSRKKDLYLGKALY
jgi:hypothetical protein